MPTQHTIMVEGARRSFLLAEPPAETTAVVLSLHGTRSSAAAQVRLSRMAGLADSAGALVAFPQAVVPVGSGFEWDQHGDMAFLVRLIDELRSHTGAPGGRVCMSGMSGGARMSSHFAAARADLVGAVAAVAGLRAPDGVAPARPVPVIAFHGTSDRINRYQGAGTARWNESVPEAARQWALANGLPEEPTTAQVTAKLTRLTYGGEGVPGEVTLWTAQGAGHTWPGTRLGLFLRLFLGPTNTEVDATAEIWSFARRHAGQD